MYLFLIKTRRDWRGFSLFYRFFFFFFYYYFQTLNPKTYARAAKINKTKTFKMIYRLESTNTRFRHRLRKHLDNYPATYNYMEFFNFVWLHGNDCVVSRFNFRDYEKNGIVSVVNGLLHDNDKYFWIWNKRQKIKKLHSKKLEKTRRNIRWHPRNRMFIWEKNHSRCLRYNFL